MGRVLSLRFYATSIFVARSLGAPRRYLARDMTLPLQQRRWLALRLGKERTGHIDGASAEALHQIRVHGVRNRARRCPTPVLQLNWVLSVLVVASSILLCRATAAAGYLCKVAVGEALSYYFRRCPPLCCGTPASSVASLAAWLTQALSYTLSDPSPMALARPPRGS